MSVQHSPIINSPNTEVNNMYILSIALIIEFQKVVSTIYSATLSNTCYRQITNHNTNDLHRNSNMHDHGTVVCSKLLVFN